MKHAKAEILDLCGEIRGGRTPGWCLGGAAGNESE